MKPSSVMSTPSRYSSSPSVSVSGTATVPSSMDSSSGRSVVESVTRPRAVVRQASCCSTMSSILVRSMCPSSATAAKKRCGSLVWMCTRRRASPPATTSDSPSSAERTMTSSRESGVPPRGVSSASVQKRYRSSISSCSPEKGGRPCGWASMGTHAGSLPLNESMSPSRKIDEPLPARVHHVAAGEDLELARRGGESLPRRHQTAVQQFREVLLLRAAAELARPGAQHREDGALTGVLQSRVGRLRATDGGGRELRPVDLAQPLHRGGEPVEELGEDRPGIATGSVQGAVGGDARGVTHGVGSGAPEPGRRRLERRRQVGARVRVAHREDVDAVQLLLLAHDRERARAHRAREHLSAEPGRVVDRVGHL